MTPQAFLLIIARTAPDIKRIIESGSQWELFAHGLIVNALRDATGRIPSREMKYAPFVGSALAGSEACDLAIQDGSQYIWVEAKVESAHNQLKFSNLSANKVTDLDEGVNRDVEKLSWLKPSQFAFSGGDGSSEVQSETAVLSKWILVIAWSPKGIAKVQSTVGNNIFADISTGILFWLAVV